MNIEKEDMLQKKKGLIKERQKLGRKVCIGQRRQK